MVFKSKIMPILLNLIFLFIVSINGLIIITEGVDKDSIGGLIFLAFILTFAYTMALSTFSQKIILKENSIIIKNGVFGENEIPYNAISKIHRKGLREPLPLIFISAFYFDAKFSNQARIINICFSDKKLEEIFNYIHQKNNHIIFCTHSKKHIKN